MFDSLPITKTRQKNILIYIFEVKYLNYSITEKLSTFDIEKIITRKPFVVQSSKTTR